MPDFGRPDSRGSGSGEPSLDAVRRTDSFIDALAGGRPVIPQDAADAELAALLGGWRDELRWPPATGLLSDADVMAAFNSGRAAGRTQKRSGPDPQRWTDTSKRNRRSLSVIGASAAAVLCIGGFGAVVAGSGPGDALYGVRTMLFGSQKQVRDDQVGLAAKTELNQVQTLISQGDWQQAQDKLVAVSTQVATIDDQQQKQELLDQFNDLSAKVVERDPAATAPPGVVYTVAPSSAALVPAVEPNTPTSTTTETPSSTPASSSASTTTTTGAPTTTSSAEPEPSSSSSSPTTTAATTSAAPESAQTTTPTSAEPSAATAPPPAVSPSAPASPTSVGTAPEAPRAASGTPEPVPSTVSQTPAAPGPAAESAPGSAVESVPPSAVVTPPPPVVATTTAVPVPAAP